MHIKGEGVLLRVFLGEQDRCDSRPLYETIVSAAREQGLAGATVLRGIEGYGASSRMHTARLLRLSADLSIVVEIVDKSDRIDAFMEHLDMLFEKAGCGGLVTRERVDIIRYHPASNSKDIRADEGS
jgi:PII-like signaling protein